MSIESHLDHPISCSRRIVRGSIRSEMKNSDQNHEALEKSLNAPKKSKKKKENETMSSMKNNNAGSRYSPLLSRPRNMFAM